MAGGHEKLHVWVTALSAEQRREPVQTRRAKNGGCPARSCPGPSPLAVLNAAPCLAQVVHRQIGALIRAAALEGRRQGGRLRSDAHDVEQSHRSRGSGRCTERLEIIFTWPDLQVVYHRHTSACQAPQQVAEHGKKGPVSLNLGRHFGQVNQQLAAAVLRAGAAQWRARARSARHRCPAGPGSARCGHLSPNWRTRSCVRFAPGDLLAKRGTVVSLIGRGGPGGDAAHALGRPASGDGPGWRSQPAPARPANPLRRARRRSRS